MRIISNKTISRNIIIQRKLQQRRNEYQVKYLIRNFDDIFGLLPYKIIYFYGIFFYGLLGLDNQIT